MLKYEVYPTSNNLNITHLSLLPVKFLDNTFQSYIAQSWSYN